MKYNKPEIMAVNFETVDETNGMTLYALSNWGDLPIE